MFRTIRAKFTGSPCRRCGFLITLGQRMRYGGPGRCYHLAAECGTHGPRAPRLETRSTLTVFSSGAEVFTNVNGRCEDAPCCGCCS